MTSPALPPLWRQREYMLLWTGQVAATLGGSASGIVVPLLVLAIWLGGPRPVARMDSIHQPFAQADFSGVPAPAPTYREQEK